MRVASITLANYNRKFATLPLMRKHYGVFIVHTDAFWRHITHFINGERSKVINLEVNVLLLNKTQEEYRGY